MKAAIEAGDVDEAARQGQHAGTATVEAGLGSADRATRLAAIAAAPLTEGRPELLEALAATAASPDRRIALPAARAARTIARELVTRAQRDELSDDHATADIEHWQRAWADLARDRQRWIELRVTALDIVAALDLVAAATRPREAAETGGPPPRVPGGVPLEGALADPDPAFRRAALALAPVPLPPALRAPLVATVIRDTDDHVALAAAQALCADLVAEPARPILAALGEPGLARVRAVITRDDADVGAVRDAARCLAADRAPASAAALRAIKRRLP